MASTFSSNLKNLSEKNIKKSKRDLFSILLGIGSGIAGTLALTNKKIEEIKLTSQKINDAKLLDEINLLKKQISILTTQTNEFKENVVEMSNDLSVCDMNLTNALNKNVSDLISRLNFFGDLLQSVQLKNINILTYEKNLTNPVERQKILFDLKSIIYIRSFNIMLESNNAFNFSNETSLVDPQKFSANGFLQFVYSILNELQQKKLI